MRIINFLLIVLLVAAINTDAAEYFSGKTIKVAFGDTLDQDLFAGCNEIQIFGYAAGDIYGACESFKIEGKVSDDVLAACRSFELNGIIDDGLIVFAETITIAGTVRGDVLAFGREVRLTDRTKLEGNIFIGTGEFYQDGATIAGNVSGGSGKVYLNGKIGGKVELEVQNIEFGSGYSAGGGTIITVPEGFDESSISFAPSDLEIYYEETDYFFQTGFFYWSFFAFLVTGLLIILVFKNSSKDYVSYARSNLPVSLGAGVIFAIVTPTVLTIISFFVITIPAALIVFFIYLILIYLSFIFSAIYAGDYLRNLVFKTNGDRSLIWPLVIGLIVICLAVQIPYLGWLFGITFICFGSGSLIMYIWHTKKNGNAVAT